MAARKSPGHKGSNGLSIAALYFKTTKRETTWGPRDYVLVTGALSLERSLDQWPDTSTQYRTNTPVREMTIAHRKNLKSESRRPENQ